MASARGETRQHSGSELLIKALVDQGVEVVFGYPGGAVLPIYDALFQQNSLRHILVRHEQPLPRAVKLKIPRPQTREHCVNIPTLQFLARMYGCV